MMRQRGISDACDKTAYVHEQPALSDATSAMTPFSGGGRQERTSHLPPQGLQTHMQKVHTQGLSKLRAGM